MKKNYLKFYETVSLGTEGYNNPSHSHREKSTVARNISSNKKDFSVVIVRRNNLWK